jgi:hypothetical protein
MEINKESIEALIGFEIENFDINLDNSEINIKVRPKSFLTVIENEVTLCEGGSFEVINSRGF